MSPDAKRALLRFGAGVACALLASAAQALSGPYGVLVNTVALAVAASVLLPNTTAYCVDVLCEARFGVPLTEVPTARRIMPALISGCLLFGFLMTPLFGYMDHLSWARGDAEFFAKSAQFALLFGLLPFLHEVGRGMEANSEVA